MQLKKKKGPEAEFYDAVFSACVAYVDAVFGEKAMDKVGLVNQITIVSVPHQHPHVEFKNEVCDRFEFGAKVS